MLNRPGCCVNRRRATIMRLIIHRYFWIHVGPKVFDVHMLHERTVYSNEIIQGKMSSVIQKSYRVYRWASRKRCVNKCHDVVVIYHAALSLKRKLVWPVVVLWYVVHFILSSISTNKWRDVENFLVWINMKIKTCWFCVLIDNSQFIFFRYAALLIYFESQNENNVIG